MKLNTLSPAPGSRRGRRRLGCGTGSGHGKTGGRGQKGQKSRSGGKVARGFEGGQMPLIRRLPKRGFTSMKEGFQIVNVAALECFKAGAKVDAEALCKAGLIRNTSDPVKILGHGELTKKLDIVAAAASGAALKKVEIAGGSLMLAGAA